MEGAEKYGGTPNMSMIDTLHDFLFSTLRRPIAAICRLADPSNLISVTANPIGFLEFAMLQTLRRETTRCPAVAGMAASAQKCRFRWGRISGDLEFQGLPVRI